MDIVMERFEKEDTSGLTAVQMYAMSVSNNSRYYSTYEQLT